MLKQSTQEIDYSCPFNDHGMICGKKGTMSPTTNGTGPWYCRDHAWVFMHDDRMKQSNPASADVQAEASQYCKDLGLDTTDKMRSWIKSRIPLIGHREPGED